MNATTLTQLSPNDEKFIRKKDESEYLGRLLTDHGYKDLGQKFSRCGDFLEFKTTPEGDIRLFSANFCKSALCPMCSWRRARQWRKRILTSADKIGANHRWLFLTLTIKNRPLKDLHNSLDQLNEGWKELTKNFLNEFLDGYLRIIEISRALPQPSITEEICHPHIHSLLCINPKYFSEYYLTHYQWRETWKKSIDAEYLPIVNIKALPGEISPKITAEIAKYTLKPGSFLGKYKRNKRGNIMGENWLGLNPEQQKANFFSELYEQIYHRRLISSGGIVKESLGKDDDDLIGTGNQEAIGDGWTAQFEWKRGDEKFPNYYLRY